MDGAAIAHLGPTRRRGQWMRQPAQTREVAPAGAATVTVSPIRATPVMNGNLSPRRQTPCSLNARSTARRKPAGGHGGRSMGLRQSSEAVARSAADHAFTGVDRGSGTLQLHRDARVSEQGADFRLPIPRCVPPNLVDFGDGEVAGQRRGRSRISTCSIVCGMTPSSAATTSRAWSTLPTAGQHVLDVSDGGPAPSTKPKSRPSGSGT